jgi:hypothetical protein
MHIDFDPLQIDWSLFANSQHEQVGGYNVFRGQAFQRGAGLGSVFRSFLRYLLPMGKAIGSAIGHEGLHTGNRVLSNVLEGKDLKETLVNESKAGLKNLLDKASNNLQKGKGFDFKRYAKEKQIPKIARRKNINKLASTIGPPNFMPAKGRKKRIRKDAFGQY